MDELERSYFEQLHSDRLESAKMLEKPSMRGIKKSVVEKYSDQAHFIYELLQNANDTHATKVRFVLENDRLIFAHNGTRFFSITNPNNEDSDSENGALGDVNAITSIANSNKTEASIGKFGVGFKAVFQYTSTPYVYDPNFSFKIERFIVPELLDEDFEDREQNETLFVFPFDHPTISQEDAYQDISNKLKHLVYPLLFLPSLQEIVYSIGNERGSYKKSIEETANFDQGFDKTTGERIHLVRNHNGVVITEKLWLFSRTHDYTYSVGFFLDDKDKLRPVNETAFCFFPTKETTGLHFIIHAPFLLTDSREGIRAGVAHNKKLIRELAQLSSDALGYLKEIGEKKGYQLIDDQILRIIPYDPDKFNDEDDIRKISFKPFFQEIHRKMKNATILPSTEGYTSRINAFWAANTTLPCIFGNQQLKLLTGDASAKWAFPTIGRDEIRSTNQAMYEYIEDITKSFINDRVAIAGRGHLAKMVPIIGVTSSFIEAQSFEWLDVFYKWLSETSAKIDLVKQRPIFLDQYRKAVAAYDENDNPILFLPTQESTEFETIHPAILRNENSRKFVLKIGITEPSLKSRIYTIILPQYQNGKVPFSDTDDHFRLFFEYYSSCPTSEFDEFVSLIQECEFAAYYTAGNHELQCGKVNTMYLANEEIQTYFETKIDTRFLALDHYNALIKESERKQLINFFKKLGLKTEITIYRKELDSAVVIKRPEVPFPHSTRDIAWEEPYLDGCKEIIDYIEANQSDEKSLLLWSTLLHTVEVKCNLNRPESVNELFSGVCRYFYRTPKEEYFDSETATLLKNSKWLKNKAGIYVSPRMLSQGSMDEMYNISSDRAQALLKFLGVQEGDCLIEDDSNLSETQKEKIHLAEKLISLGLDESMLEDFLEYRRMKAAKSNKGNTLSEDKVEKNCSIEATASKVVHGEINASQTINSSQIEYTGKNGLNNYDLCGEKTARVINDIVKITRDHDKKRNIEGLNYKAIAEDIDSDEYTPFAIDYEAKIERAKQKSALEIEKIEQLEELQENAMHTQKYSFKWFRTLLEMECLNSKDKNANSREVSISFSKVRKEPGTKRTLILEQPNRYIPHFMEDLADIILKIHVEDQIKNVPIEVANINSYTLKVKLKNLEDINEIDLENITSATIDAQSPVFLLEELYKGFCGMDYPDDFDMQNHLCKNIEFIFGPPGTGKTTYLAKNVLLPMMSQEKPCKVLVLTPTNKSADVLTKRLMEVCGDASAYDKWLVRFGTTVDESIESSGVYKDKMFDIRAVEKNVTVTTIARFSYDYYMPQGSRVYLNGINWDYIVVDEASMIPLANIIYPLYKKTPKKFIIAGDPFQIEPINTVDLWKDENIYTMVNLDSFAQPQTVPYAYPVKLLTTQYRSIPAVGEIFSNFAYDGILKHHRSVEEQKVLDLGDIVIQPLNIIKFPVRKYESIFRAKRLQRSSAYHIYSALFTYEFVRFIAKKIAEQYPETHYQIGIIAPYRAQADLIEKLVASESFPAFIKIQVGTIHGFQGDECNIVFAVFNPPPGISSSKNIFLNKRNIINVSISRARDHLFIMMPDDQTENVENLRLVKKIESLIKQTNAWTEAHSSDLEQIMFGDSNYLETNAFSTNHQAVNVYGLPEKIYEVRTEDSAVDIQLHREMDKMKIGQLSQSEKDDIQVVPIREELYDQDVSNDGDSQQSITGEQENEPTSVSDDGSKKSIRDRLKNLFSM